MRNNSSGDFNAAFIVFWFAVMGLSIASVISEGVDVLMRESVAEGIIILALVFLAAFKIIIHALKMMFPSLGLGKRKKRKDQKKTEYGKFPHFGDGMKEEKVTEIIEKSEFSPYVTRDGQTLENVTISEDQKWICILDGYFPADLVCGYNEKDRELLAIDGAAIKLPKKARSSRIKKDIDAFFTDRGIYYKSLPKNADDCYYAVRNTIGRGIDREDFGRIRYLWEKGVINEVNEFWATDDNNNDCRPGKGVDINVGVFEYVLSDSDIQNLVDNVRGGSVSLSRFLKFSDYFNEFSICNGVELLKKLGYPKNAEGIDFLFNCLGDVDEAYFMPAVEVLKDYPEQLLHEKIETYIKQAYENYDAVGLAGLMYLAKEIGYEIKYIASVNGSSEIADEIANGGMAYLKQA